MAPVAIFFSDKHNIAAGKWTAEEKEVRCQRKKRSKTNLRNRRRDRVPHAHIETQRDRNR